MNDIFCAPPGSKVKYLGENGYDSDRDYAKNAGLIVGEWYTLDCVVIGSWSSDIYLEEFYNIPFNSVMFECADYDETFEDWWENFNANEM